MTGIMNEYVIVKEYEFDKPLIQKIDSIIDICIRLSYNCHDNCHNKYFHTFDHICVYDINFKNTSNKETVNFTISGKSMSLYESSKRLTIARENGFEFNKINKYKIKIYSNLSQINKHLYIKFRIPIMHRHSLKKLSQNREYVKTCADLNDPFHFTCRKWYSNNNPQC